LDLKPTRDPEQAGILERRTDQLHPDREALAFRLGVTRRNTDRRQTGEVRRDTGISLRESSGSGTAVWNTTEGVLESLESRQAIRMAGSPPELRGGELELVVRSRLQIDRVEEAWTSEPRPKAPAKESTPAEEPADA